MKIAAYGALLLVAVLFGTLGVSFIVTAFKMVGHRSSPVYATFWAGLIMLLSAALFGYAAYSYYPE